MKSHPYSLIFKTKAFARLLHARSNSIYCNHDIWALISGLFFWSCPTTITFFIISILIWIAIKAFSRRTLSHVSEEILELSPSRTDFYPATSIPMKFRGFRVGASRYHAGPNTINASLAFSVSSVRSSFWHERLSFNFQRLCKWRATDGNRRSLRQSSLIPLDCQLVWP